MREAAAKKIKKYVFDCKFYKFTVSIPIYDAMIPRKISSPPSPGLTFSGSYLRFSISLLELSSTKKKKEANEQ